MWGKSAAPVMQASSPARLLIVDDSGFMRMAIRKMVEHDSGIEVVGEARNGALGVEMAHSLRPDVITMDVEMPEMDGLEATRRIMRETPTPIIMVSSLTQASADVTVRALREGAVDYISKSSSFVALDIIQIESELRAKIRHWAHPQPRKPQSVQPVRADVPAVSVAGPIDLVVIGVSTGGPKTLPELLTATGRLGCPVVVAQHMPEIFTASFAQQLGRDTGLLVREGADGDVVEPGTVTILKGGTDTTLVSRTDGRFGLSVRLQPGTIHPSVNALFLSAARVARRPLGVILTGMGDDGTLGAQEMVRRKFPVFVQDPDTCIVGGMPGAAMKAGAATASLPLGALADRLRALAGSTH